ncbi:hypothetical protein [Virgibacillus sp. DJP39]|uniref:hypothetical protein n=1 Tax=Virgibacillus sp. DJP39 TaxID=3409790 RepID=UPI003BB81335
MYFLVIITFFILMVLYRRHMPVWGIGELREISNVLYDRVDVVILDIRDYQTSIKNQIVNAYCLPLPYLNRHYTDLPIEKDIIVVASDQVEVNLGARFLRKKGYNVVGFYLPSQVRKDSYNYGVQCANEK